jgi:hypothetical protein
LSSFLALFSSFLSRLSSLPLPFPSASAGLVFTEGTAMAFEPEAGPLEVLIVVGSYPLGGVVSDSSTTNVVHIQYSINRLSFEFLNFSNFLDSFTFSLLHISVVPMDIFVLLPATRRCIDTMAQIVLSPAVSAMPA